MKNIWSQSKIAIGTEASFDGILNIQDLLKTLRSKWDHNQYSFINDKKWDHLAAHYSNLDGTQNIRALGQELTLYNTALYTIKEKDGNYSIVPIAKEQMKEFESESKAEGQEANLCMQEGKNFGDPAFRFNSVADSLPSETYALESSDSYYIDFVGKQLFTKSPGAHPKEYNYYRLDLSVWPPKKYPLSKPIINITYSSTHKLYAALDLEEESHFNIKRIRIGHEFNDLCAWDCIQLNEEIGGTHFFRWVELAWVGNDLLLIDDAHLWKIKDAAIGGRVFERVSDINACGCCINCSPTLIRTKNGGSFIPSDKKLMEWKDGELQNTGITITKLYAKRFSTAPLGKAGFITTTRRGRIAVHTQTDTGAIHFLDLVDSPSLTCVKELNQDWIAFFTNETYSERDSDLAQFWNHKTDTWLRMKYGALNSSTIHNIMLDDEGTAFIADNQGHLHKITNFFENLAECNNKEEVEEMNSNEWYDGRGVKKAPPSYLKKKECISPARKQMTFEERLDFFGKNYKLTEQKKQRKK
ncbi:hypothetical protein [Bacteroides sp.]|uniref:hypothetical protein n=1 Tax=Bacteroides sp. TaxID=29523 RepID=UPI00258BDD67|nr:hypothetical protein [Bacteroides sp.]